MDFSLQGQQIVMPFKNIHQALSISFSLSVSCNRISASIRLDGMVCSGHYFVCFCAGCVSIVVECFFLDGKAKRPFLTMPTTIGIILDKLRCDVISTLLAQCVCNICSGCFFLREGPCATTTLLCGQSSHLCFFNRIFFFLNYSHIDGLAVMRTRPHIMQHIVFQIEFFLPRLLLSFRFSLSQNTMDLDCRLLI